MRQASRHDNPFDAGSKIDVTLRSHSDALSVLRGTSSPFQPAEASYVLISNAVVSVFRFTCAAAMGFQPVRKWLSSSGTRACVLRALVRRGICFTASQEIGSCERAPGTAKPSTMNTYTKKGRGVGGENEQAPSFFAELREPYAQHQADGRL
jgi:hypothetical protein